MKILTISEVLEYSNFILTDGAQQFRFIIDFHNIKPVKVNNKILIHESLLNENNVCFSFEKTTDYSVEDIKDLELKEYAILKQNKTFVALKRIYG